MIKSRAPTFFASGHEEVAVAHGDTGRGFQATARYGSTETLTVWAQSPVRTWHESRRELTGPNLKAQVVNRIALRAVTAIDLCRPLLPAATATQRARNGERLPLSPRA
jgi:hypothetical protein